jgi:hypothetical protein
MTKVQVEMRTMVREKNAMNLQDVYVKIQRQHSELSVENNFRCDSTASRPTDAQLSNIAGKFFEGLSETLWEWNPKKVIPRLAIFTLQT